MNPLDWAAAAVLLLSLFLGLWRGLVYEVLSVAVWVGAFVLAQMYAAKVALQLPLPATWAPPLPTALAFVLIFVGCAFVGGLLAALMRRLTRAVGLRPIDRALGGAFGLLRGVVLLLGLTLVLGLTPWQQHPLWQASVAGAWLGQLLHALQPLLPAALSNALSAGA